MADDSDKFVAIYNAGISSRLLGEYHRACREFYEALAISTPLNDFESMSLCFGQIAIAQMLKEDFDAAQSSFDQCMQLAKQLKAVRMQLECLLCQAYIAFDRQDWQRAKEYFD